MNLEDLTDNELPSALTSNFHYFVRCSDGGKRKRQEDDKLIGKDSFDDHYFIRCYSADGKSYFVAFRFLENVSLLPKMSSVGKKRKKQEDNKLNGAGFSDDEISEKMHEWNSQRYKYFCYQI